MFKLNANPEFTADVQITRPGEPKPGTIRFRFRHMGRTAFKAWVETAGGRDDPDYLLDAVAGWEGVTDASGQPVEFSREALAQLLDAFPAAGQDIFVAYGKALHESRTGN
jgi:hypothetical protein